MTIDTTSAGLAFRAQFEAREECPHATYPEVMETPWVTGLIAAMLSELERMLIVGTNSDELASAAEHAFITVAAAGVAAGKAMASEQLMDSIAESFSLESVEWSALPDTEEE